ncbi:MAG: hypothetical protein IIC82_05745 [Chloroflexi bacterium]|nr:hypothetical protein [Chloroflexota bacterium]
MRPRRHLPSWKRLLFEYFAMLFVFFVAWAISGGALGIALIATVVAMFVLRATRPRVDEPPQ